MSDAKTDDRSEPGMESSVESLRVGHLEELTAEMNKLAAAVIPLLSETHRKTQERVRTLEQRLVRRQERPTVKQIADLIVSIQRLHPEADVATHAVEGLLAILYGLGYEQFGEVGDVYDPADHEAIEAVQTDEPVVTVVHARGLRAFDDVITQARVSTGPRIKIVPPATTLEEHT